MIGRRLIATALCLSFAGCATVWSFPEPMGGLRGHLHMLGARESGDEDPPGWGQILWVMFIPVTVTDLALSLGVDVALLPLLGPLAVVETIMDSRRAAWAEKEEEDRAKEAARRSQPTPEQAEAVRARQEKTALERLTRDR